MENKKFENISFDYYANTPSYVKMIVDMLPESVASNEKKSIIIMLYNFYLNHIDKDKVKEIIMISGLFREKISLSDLNTIARQVEFIYSNFLERIIFNSINRDKIFETMNECVKVFVDYYELYNANRISDNNDYVNVIKR